MEYRNVGGIFWRLDASGNLTGYDSTGTVIGKFAAGGLFSSAINKGTFSQNTAILTTASASHVYTGDFVSITPQISGKVLITALYTRLNSDTANVQSSFRLYSGTGGAGPDSKPAGGTAISGTQQVPDCTVTTAGIGTNASLNISILLTGLTNGTQITFATSASTGAGNVTWASLAFSRFWAIEV